MASAYDDAGLGSLPSAAAWIASLLLLGIGLWHALNRGQPRKDSWSLALALGMAAAVPVLAMASAAGNVFPGVGAVGAAGAGLCIVFRRSILRRNPFRRPEKLEAVFAVAAIVGAAIMLPVVVRPELSYDVLSYHLPVARHLRSHFGYMEGNYYSRLPAAAFLVYAPVVPSAGGTLEAPGVRLILWCSLVAGSALCGRVAGQLGARRSPRMAAAALYAWHPMVSSSLLNSHSDLLTAMFALAAFERALSAMRSRRIASWLLAGFLAAAAVGVKFSAAGIVFVPMFAGIAVAAAWRGTPAKALGRAFVLVAIGAFAGYAPWVLRSTVLGGNPLHPFAGSAEGWSSGQNGFLVEQHRPQSPLSAPYWNDAAQKADVLGYSLSVVPSDPETGEGGVRVSAILVLVLASLARAKHRGTRFALVAIAGGFGAWLSVGLAPARFVLPCIGVALALVATTVSKAPFFALRIGGAALLGLAFAFSALDEARNGTLSSPWRADAWRREGLLPENIHRAALDPDSGGRLLMLFEARGRWFPENAMWNTVWDVPPWAEDLRAAKDVADFGRRLHARGIDRLFVNEFEWSRLANFYGGLDPRPSMGSVGISGTRADVEQWLGAYPPFRFARFGARELRLLAEFLVLARSGATQLAPAGPVSTVWLAPIPQELRPSDRDSP